MNDHLLSRWLDPSKYGNISVTESTVTFPLYNLSGRMIGYHCYTPSLPKTHTDDPKQSKYYTWVSKPSASNNSETAVWGLETVKWNNPVLFLTEGIFDACRLHWHGFPAIACLSNNPIHLLSWLKIHPSTKVACVQGDNAGKKLAKFGDEQVWLPSGKDVGDLTEEEFSVLFAKWL